MKRALATLAVATAALLTPGGTSQAGDINIRITMSDRGSAYPARYYDRDHHAGDIQCIRAPCFPARERPRWDHWGRGHGYGRPVLVRRGDGGVTMMTAGKSSSAE